uniref:Immunoglobulin domain-containing protein n=1 Tax=Seriola lalandi dorsalis TaxID=1841481 RepID=A0A3B4X365_SERLL
MLLSSGSNHVLSVISVVSCVCCFTGSSAVSPVFVQKGKDLLLEVMKPDVPEDFFIFQWKVNGSNTLVSFPPGREPIVSDVYTGRVEASVKNFSVKLKNLQEADSGVYTARVTGTQGDKTPAGYSVTVQVSPVAMTVDSVSSSSDSCSLTVTCSTQYSHHINSTFTCDTNTCSQGGGERSKVISSGASLNVNLLNDLIICNHSNHISWTNDIFAVPVLFCIGFLVCLCVASCLGPVSVVIVCPALICFTCVQSSLPPLSI